MISIIYSKSFCSLNPPIHHIQFILQNKWYSQNWSNKQPLRVLSPFMLLIFEMLVLTRPLTGITISPSNEYSLLHNQFSLIVYQLPKPCFGKTMFWKMRVFWHDGTMIFVRPSISKRLITNGNVIIFLWCMINHLTMLHSMVTTAVDASFSMSIKLLKHL